jgi:predicted TIM-barrel fold metal-dependent hydrolase
MLKKIDAHFHVNFCGYTANKIVNYLNEKQIEQCWLYTWEENNPPIPSLYEHLSIEDVLNAYNKYPDRIVPFYAPDPCSKGIKEKFDKYIKMGIKGCGELKVTYKWEEPLIEDYLEIVSELELPLVFHMEAPREQYVKTKNNKFENLLEQLLNGAFNGVTRYYLTKAAKYFPHVAKKISSRQKHFPGYLYDFAFLEKRIKQFSDIKFIGHGPHFWNNIATPLSPKYIHQRGKIKDWGVIDRLLEEYDNLYCDISGKSGFNALTRDTQKSKIFLEKHSHKIIFGTDNTYYSFDELLASFKLPKNKLEDIYYNNAKKLIS